MTERSNPLLNKGPSGFRFQTGSPEARIQLQEHCDKLNAMKTDRWWFVFKGADGKLMIDNRARQEQHSAPRCTPAEARQILRQHGLQGSAFAKSILAALGEYGDDQAKAKAA